MRKLNAHKKMSQTQLYPVAFKPSESPKSWVALQNEKFTSNVDYLVVHKPKTRMSSQQLFSRIFRHIIIWEIFVTITILIGYVATTTIYVYRQPAHPFDWKFYFILICDIVYAADAISGICSKLIAATHPDMVEYPRGGGVLFVDILIAVPYSTGYLVLFKNTKSQLFLLLRLSTTTSRLYKLVALFGRFEKSIQKRRWVIFYVKFFAYFLVIQHFFTCLWYLVPSLANGGNNNNTVWWYPIVNTTRYQKSVLEWYLLTSYFSFTLLSHTGFGDFYPANMTERSIAIIAMCIGIFIWSYYISCLTILFMRQKYPQYKIRKQLADVIKQLNLICADKKLIEQCARYYELLWTKRKGILKTKKLLDLPDMITVHMSQKSCAFVLKYSIIFNDKPASFLRNVCHYIKHEIYSPGQSVYSENKLKGKMIIIKCGTVNVLSEEDNETPMISFGAGTCLGEVALVINLPSKVTVNAASYLEIYAIYTSDFYNIISNYPEFYSDIRQSIATRIAKRIKHSAKSKSNWRDLKQLLRDNADSQAISNPIITKYISLYKISSTTNDFRYTAPDTIEKKFQWVRNDDSISMLLWEWLIIVCAIAVAIFYPYYATFRRSFPIWFVHVSNVIHIIFVIDIYMLLTTCIIKDGKKIDTIKGILEERMDRFSFYMDVIACFYLEVYAVLIDDEERYYDLFKLNRILKIVRISTLCQRLTNDLVRNLIKIYCVKYAIFISFSLYWSSMVLYAQNCFFPACIYDGWFLSKLKISVPYKELIKDDFGKLLMTAYYALTNTLTVGIGDILPINMQDMMFTVVIIIICKIIFGYCLAEFSSSLTFGLRSLNKYEDLRLAMKFNAGIRSIPYKLEKRVRTYFDIQWRYNEAHAVLAKKSLVCDLPTYLGREVLAREKLATLRKFVIFEEMDDEFLGYLLHNSRTLVVGPDEIVTYFGSINREMYFICRGSCLKQTDNNTYETIGPGSCIGFSSLLFGLPSLTNVCTLTHCILIYINVRTFNNALHQTPLLYRTVYKTRQQILAKYQSNYEVKMIENPHYTKRKKKFKMRHKLTEKTAKNQSFVNAYKYCVSTKESYSKLSNRAGKMCFLKYLLMPISILPYGPFLKIWYIVRLTIALTLFFVIPVQYLFSPYRSEVHYFEFVLEAVVYVDFYLRFHVGFYGDDNQLVIHPWTTAEHYLKGQFFLDVVIWFPYSLTILTMYKHTEGHSEFAHSLSPHIFHCYANLVKILDIYRVFIAIRYFGMKWNKFCVFRFFKYIFFTILMVHSWTMVLMITTCRYLHSSDVPPQFTIENMTRIPGIIAKPSAEFNLYCYEHSWLNRSHFGNYTTVGEVYLAGIYFVFQTMAGVGFGDIFPENKVEIVMVILIIITGFIFYGYILADVISHSTRPSQTLLIYESKFLHLINYMKQEKVNHNLRIRIEEYIQYKWNRTRNMSIHSLLSQMNSTLHEDVALYLYETTLRHVPMFETVDHSFFRVIGKDLKEQYYMEGDTVLHINDIVDNIYIIHKGTVELSSPTNMIPVIMGVGGVFGNVFYKHPSLSGIVVRAMRNLDLLCLNVETFRKIMMDYPFIEKKINSFPKNEKQKNYAIPNSMIDDGNVYLNPNVYWTSRSSSGKKRSWIYSCRDTFNREYNGCNVFTGFLLCATYLNYILTTYQFCFQQYCNPLLTFAVIMDVIFLLKFCIEINAPNVKPAGLLSKRSFITKCIQRRWRRILDSLANLPFGYAVLFVPFISSDNSNYYFSLCRLLTLLRLYYMFHFFLVLKEKLLKNRFFLELSIFVLLSTMLCHLLACLWYLIICPWKQCSDTSWIPASATQRPEELYVISLYVVVNTITCTGVGDITPRTATEIFVVIVCIAVAKICLGCFIAQLIRMLRCGSVWLMKYETVMEHLRSYYANMGARKNQINYMIRYMSMLWKKKNGLQKYELITDLPRTLRIDLMTTIYGKLIKESYIFCRTERDFIRQLCLQLKHRTYFPGDYIVRDGDVDSCMYFIHRGDVQILTIGQTVNETVHEILHKDEVFGIVQGLFKEIPHHFSFRALTLVDLAILKLNDWGYLMDFFPKSKDVIYQRVEEIYYTI